MIGTSVIESRLSNTDKYRDCYVHYGEKELKERIQPALLRILLDFDEICRKAGVCYMITGGVVLGAIREKGFIAWDDDLDVLVFPDGYDRLQQAIETCGMGDRYEFISPDQTDDVTLDGKFMSKTVTLGDILGDAAIGYPLYIDVLAIENVPDNRLLRSVKSFLSGLLVLSYNSIRTMKKRDPLLDLMSRDDTELRRNLRIRRIAAIPGVLIGQHRMYRLLKRVCSYNDNATKNVTVPFGVLRYSGEMQPRHTFEKTVMVEFEGHLFPAAQDYTSYLSNRYGDYMVPPPVCERGVKCFRRRADWKMVLNRINSEER